MGKKKGFVFVFLHLSFSLASLAQSLSSLLGLFSFSPNTYHLSFQEEKGQQTEVYACLQQHKPVSEKTYRCCTLKDPLSRLPAE